MHAEMPQGWRLISLKETSSTNEEAKRLAEGSDNVAVQADVQTSGRGRMGRHWSSPAGNLYVSLCLALPDLKDAGFYSFISAVSLACALKEIRPGLNIRCKWPNDLLVGGKKISGILLETDGRRRLVIGIGVNLVSSPSENVLYPVTSLIQEGADTDAGTVLGALVRHFDRWRKRFEREGPAPVLKAWEENAYGIGGPIAVNLPDRRLEGIFYGLDKDGCLLLNMDDKIVKITAGDVFFGTAGKN